MTDQKPTQRPEGADSLEALELARRFHDTHERLAPSFGYETRPETRVFDPTTPNGRLMIAVCAEINVPPSSSPAQTTDKETGPPVTTISYGCQWCADSRAEAVLASKRASGYEHRFHVVAEQRDDLRAEVDGLKRELRLALETIVELRGASKRGTKRRGRSG